MIAVIGASGQLGHDLVAAFSDVATAALMHEDISIESRASVVAMLERVKPSVVVNTAAFHKVPACETNQVQALLVNAVGVDNLAAECERRGIRFLTVSTDYVFDGEKGAPYLESDEPHPVNVYGVSKLAGELLTRSSNPQHYIVRTSGLFGARGSRSKGYTFIDRILRQASEGQELRVVTDMHFSPSYTRDVAAAIRQIVERGAFGLYHITNSGNCTWYEFAQHALRCAGLSDTIVPIESTSWNDGVRRPRNSSLAHGRFQQQGLGELADWKDAVERYIKERAA